MKDKFRKPALRATIAGAAVFGIAAALAPAQDSGEKPIVLGISPAPQAASAPDAQVPAVAAAPIPAVADIAEDAPATWSDIDNAPEAAAYAKTTGGVFDEKKVAVPEAAEGKTVLDAMNEIARSAGKTLSPLGTNGLEKLDVEYVKPDKLERENYRDLIGELLPDDTIDIWDDPDSRFIYLGLSDEVSVKHTQSDVQKLSRNHTRIQLAVKDKTLYDVVLMIADASKANILTAYMEKEDQVTDERDEAEETAAVGVGELGANSAAAKTETVRRVTYRTQGPAEWRTVLRSVLEPDYAFDEKDGMVRVATKAKFEQMKKAEQDAIKMEYRYIRVYHANPEDIVARVTELGITENAGAKIQVAPYQEKSKKDNVNGFRHNLSSSSTSLSTGNSSIGDTGSTSSGSWGNLLRPKNPPAVIVLDNPGNLDRIEGVIRSLDVREKQILIEAMILELTDSGSKQIGMDLEKMGFGSIPLFGVNYGRENYNNRGRVGSSFSESQAYNGYAYEKSRGTIGVSGKYGFVEGGTTSQTRNWNIGTSDHPVGVGSSLEVGTATAGSAHGSSIGSSIALANDAMTARVSERYKHFSSVLGPLNFNFIMSLVEEKGNGKVLSNPVITIGDHSEAVVHVGKVIPILNIEVNNAANTTGTVLVEDIEWQELVTGIMMWVGPEITDDGKSVRLWVHPKFSDVDGNQWETYGNTKYPHLVSQELDTRVTVPSGGTLLLGGLVSTSKSETHRKVPLLGDIPLLGRLFRWDSTESERNNLVILIRPTILDDETPDTGYEAPANKIIEPMLEGSGKTLADVEFKDEDDKMKRREKAIRRAIFGNREAAKAEDAAVEAVKDDDAGVEAVDEGDPAADAVAEVAPSEPAE